MIKIAVDAMGGDYAPVEMVKGAVEALKKKEQVSVILVARRIRSEGNCLLTHTPRTGCPLSTPLRSLRPRSLL